MKPFLTALCTTLIFAIPTAPIRAAQNQTEAPLVQVFLGVLKLDNQTGDWADISDNGVDVDFSSLPSGGIEAEYVFDRGWVHWGLNPGGGVAWKNKDTNISGSLTNENGGSLLVELDNSLFLAELHLGGYVRGRIHDRITTYAAAGPMVMYGELDVKNENVEAVPPQATPAGTVVIRDSDSSDFNVGFYARAGVDFEIADNQYMGLAVRYLSTELDFDKTVGKLDIKGPQYLLTFTSRL
jgi:opacity protein-like surface antigen